MNHPTENTKQYTKERRSLHLVILIPGLIALMTLGVGAVVHQTATSLAESYPSETSVRKGLDNLASYTLIASIVIAILGGLAGAVLAWSVNRSMRRLVYMTATAVPGQQLDEGSDTMSSKSFAEIDMVGRSFNKMMRDIYLNYRQRDSILLQGSAYGVITIDTSGNVMATNPRADEALEIISGEIIGSKFTQVDSKSESLSKLQTIVDEVIDSNVESREDLIEYTDTKGRQRKISITVSQIKDHSGRPNGYSVMLKPIQRYGEIEKRMREVDRLAMLGTFTFGLVHEIRNPVAAIKGLSKLLTQIDPGSKKHEEFANEIQHEASRLDRLLSELHQFANKSPESMRQECDINSILSHALTSTRMALQKKHTDLLIDEHYGKIPVVNGFQDRLMQSFSNILKNAFEATPPEGQITIRTRRLIANETSHDLVQIMITNSGSSITDDMRGKIFDPFYTTKQGGTGLGLPIATQVIVQHNGKITLHTAENYTTFEIILPAGSEPYDIKEEDKESTDAVDQELSAEKKDG